MLGILSKVISKSTLSALFFTSVAAGFSTSAYATGPYQYTDWKSGNAQFECRQLTTLPARPGYPSRYPTYNNAYKIDRTPTNGQYNLGGGRTITINYSTRNSFYFTANGVIGSVIVKAGRDVNVYAFNFRSHTIHAPNGKDISHVSFCW